MISSQSKVDSPLPTSRVILPPALPLAHWQLWGEVVQERSCLKINTFCKHGCVCPGGKQECGSPT